MKKVLFVAGSGGHTAQLALLLEQIGDRYRTELLLERSDHLGIERFAPRYKVYTACAIRGKRESILVTLFRVALNLCQSLVVLLRSNPCCILTTGPGLGIPICLLGKLTGRKVVVIESWSRTTTRSYLGRLLYPFADLFIVQWPQMLRYYTKAKYLGRLA